MQSVIYSCVIGIKLLNPESFNYRDDNLSFPACFRTSRTKSQLMKQTLFLKFQEFLRPA